MWNVSGKRKKDILQASMGDPGSSSEIVQHPHTANAAIGKENKAIADALGICQLMDCKDECASPDCLMTQQVHDFAGLPEIEAVEGFVHEKQRVRREQSQRQHQPSAVTF